MAGPGTAQALTSAALRRLLLRPVVVLSLAVVTVLLAGLAVVLFGAWAAPVALVLPLFFVIQLRGSVRRTVGLGYGDGARVTATFGPSALTVTAPSGELSLAYDRLSDPQVGTDVVSIRWAETGGVLALPRELVPDEALELIAGGVPGAAPDAPPDELPLRFRPTAERVSRMAWAAWWVLAGPLLVLAAAITAVVGLLALLSGSWMWVLFLAITVVVPALQVLQRRSIAKAYPLGCECRAASDGAGIEVWTPQGRARMPWATLGEPRWFRTCVVFRPPANRHVVTVFPREFFPTPPV